MKYYSDVLDKIFDSELELKAAELKKKQEEEQTKKKAEEKEKNALVSKEKKELSKAVEAADKKLSEAYADYEVAKDEVEKLKTEYLKKMQDILNPAKEAIESAQKERFIALSEYSKKYGAYEVCYTGDKAYQELKRMNSWVNDIFNHFFW